MNIYIYIEKHLPKNLLFLFIYVFIFIYILFYTKHERKWHGMKVHKYENTRTLNGLILYLTFNYMTRKYTIQRIAKSIPHALYFYKGSLILWLGSALVRVKSEIYQIRLWWELNLGLVINLQHYHFTIYVYKHTHNVYVCVP